ncbi:hypothetical protein ACQY0O_007998 [Thecaphora frezii]
MRLRQTLLPFVAASLALIQTANAFAITVNQVTCAHLLLTVDLTLAEYENAYAVSVLMGGEQVSEFTLSGSYTRTDLSADFYAIFFDGSEPTTGTSTVTFQLLDSSEEPLARSSPITATLDFQCGTTLQPSTTAAAPATTATSTRSGTGTSSGGSSSSSSSSGSSNTGAIAGGVVGGIVALATLGALAFLLLRRRRRDDRRRALAAHHDVDEAGSRGANDSTASLTTAPEPENSQTPMMRDISTRNVFADPPNSGGAGAEGAAPVAAGAAAADADGLGAAAIAARRSQSRSSSRSDQRRPSDPSKLASTSTDDKPLPPPADTSGEQASIAPAAVVVPAAAAKQVSKSESAEQSAPSSDSPETKLSNKSSGPSSSNHDGAAASGGPSAAGVSAAAAVDVAAPTSPKSKKWGWKRNSQAKSPAMTPADMRSLASSAPSQKSAESGDLPARSFKVIHKPVPVVDGAAATALGPHSGYATPSSASTRDNHGAKSSPSPASLTAGFGEAPAMPPQASGSGDAPAPSPMSEFGAGNMAGVGAGRAYYGGAGGGAGGSPSVVGSASSVHSTKWHQQNYNVMPNFSQRALARSSHLDEELIFGNLGMGLSPAPGLVGNGHEGGSTRSGRSRGSRHDPFSDR